jgi:hypothetical protein
MLDALNQTGNLLWVKGNDVNRATADDDVDLLLDLGALDVQEKIRVKDLECIFLTEDEITVMIEGIAKNSGFDNEKALFLSYNGVSNLNHLSALIRKIRRVSQATIIVHRDRDYLNDKEVSNWETAVRRIGARPFITSEIDIESYFASPDHLARFLSTYGGPQVEDVSNFLDDSIRDEILEDFVNGRQHIIRNRNETSSSGSIAVEANRAVSKNPWYYLNGKKKVKLLRRIFQEHGQTRFNMQSIAGFPIDSTLQEYARTVESS